MRPASRFRPVIFGICAAALLHVAAGLATAGTLYVKLSGNDAANNTCSAMDPCRSISHAVDVAEPGDTINVGAGTFLENLTITITKNLVVAGTGWLGTRVGLGWAFGGPFCCTIFYIDQSASVTLSGMTITGGYDKSAGGIYNGGTLVLDNVLIWQNTAVGGTGAALLNNGELTMTNSAVSHNNSPIGFMNGQNGIAGLSDVRVTDTYGSGSAYGGVVNFGGTLTMDRGLIAGNKGTGLWTAPVGSPPSWDCADTTLTNVTISGNSGGGIRASGNSNCTEHELTLTHVTIAANTNKAGTGALHVELMVVNLVNSILAANSGPQCGFALSIPANVTATHSLIGDNSCNVQWTVGSLIGVDPQLSPLSFATHNPFVNVFHLGATKVHKLKLGSPAIDAGGAAYCAQVDQLGTLRPIDGNGDGIAACDMGAYEYRPPGPLEGGGGPFT